MDASPLAQIEVAMDGNGTILRVNRRAEALFDYQRYEIVGHGIEMLVPFDLADRHRSQREGYSRDPATLPMENMSARARRRGGREVLVNISVRPIEGVRAVMLFIQRAREGTGRAS